MFFLLCFLFLLSFFFLFFSFLFFSFLLFSFLLIVFSLSLPFLLMEQRFFLNGAKLRKNVDTKSSRAYLFYIKVCTAAVY